jgi:transposase
MNVLRELVHRLRMGESDRAIASDMHIGRNTVSKYRHLSEKHGYLIPDTELPEVKALAAVLGPAPQPPRTVSTVIPYQQVVEELLELGVEMMTIFDRLRQNYGYTGSYSSIRRFVRHLRPPGGSPGGLRLGRNAAGSRKPASTAGLCLRNDPVL